MRLKCTLILLLFCSFASAQKLTGIWRGSFVQKQYSALYGITIQDRYKYEIQLNQLVNNALQGVTYSYKTTVFYGKTSLQGIYTKGTNNVLIKELKMLELKIEDFSEPCMMTCNLEYAKVGNKETLTGTFTSTNMKNKEDCGSGTVYLEKVPESDFEKEDFLKKPSTPTPAKPENGTVRKNLISPLSPVVPKKQDNNTGKKNTAIVPKTKYKPGAEDALVPKKQKDGNRIKTETTESTEESKTDHVTGNNMVPPPAKPLAKELTERTNNLVKTLYVDEGEIEVALYDNGEIDNDTISVYHNGDLVIPHGRLSGTPLVVKIKVDAEHPTHEFIMVADNLGEIPPNTSLMTVTAGKKRYSVFLTSDEQRNAKVMIQYKPQEDQNTRH